MAASPVASTAPNNAAGEAILCDGFSRVVRYLMPRCPATRLTGASLGGPEPLWANAKTWQADRTDNDL